MEIDTAPRPPAATPWGRLVLFVALLAPLTLFVLLPIGLGLERYVITGSSMDGDGPGGIARGAVAFERVVPVSDLQVGDVITYRRPGADADEPLVTHRIVAIDHDDIVTQGDAEAQPDPWVLSPSGPTLPRVAFTVPWIGWASIWLAHPSGWLLLVVAIVVLAVPTVRHARRRTSTLRRAQQIAEDTTAPAPDEGHATSANGAER